MIIQFPNYYNKISILQKYLINGVPFSNLKSEIKDNKGTKDENLLYN